MTALVYTREEFAAALRIGLTSFHKLAKEDPTFPKPVRVAGPTDRPKWIRAEVEAWLNAKALARHAGGEQ